MTGFRKLLASARTYVTMKVFLLLIMIHIVNSEVPQVLEPCKPSGVKYNDYCVWLGSNPQNLNDALKECSDYSGKLFQYESFQELDTVRGYLNIESITELLVGVKRIPNGAKVVEFKYFWINGTGQTRNERFFAPTTDVLGYDEEGVDCVSVTGSSLTAVDCSSKISYLCQYKCVVVGAKECLDFKSVIDHVISKTNTSLTTGPLQTTTAFLTTLPTSKDILIEILDHKNLQEASQGEVTDYITGVHEAVVNSNQSVSTEVALCALIKLADIPAVSEDDFVLYAESMSHVLTMPSTDWSKRPGQSSDILVAMEKMICAAIVEEMDQVMEGFDIKVKTINNSSQRAQLNFGFFDLEEIFLNSNIFEDAGKVSIILYNDLDTKIPSTYKDGGRTDFSSHVISVTVQSVKDNQTTKQEINQSNAVNFTLRYFGGENGTDSKTRRICSYWDVVKHIWSNDGCHLVSQNESHTSCSCDHLTSFAVLVLFYGEEIQVSNLNDKVLHIVSSAGCSFSILGLSMTIFVYFYLRIIGKERIFIHTNLCLSLLCGQLVFVVTNEFQENREICKLVAILLHFFFLSAFTWMLVEGLSLYVTCRRGIGNHSNNKVRYLLIGWGFPIVIVLISFGSEFQNYGNGPGDSCWLSLEHGLIWAFMGPMLFIVFFNVIILGLILKVFLTLKTNKQKTEAARVRASLRAMVMLLPLLGMTWILSLLVPFSIWFRYMFVIGNSLQGMLIFFLHCLCNDEVRISVAKRRASGFRSTDTDLSIVGRRKSLADVMHGYRSCDNVDVDNGGGSSYGGTADSHISVHF